MTTLQAKELSLGDVHRLFGFQRTYHPSFDTLLSLEPVTDWERQELLQIRNDFDAYLSEGKVSEGMVKVLAVFPLLRLTGYYRSPVKLRLEENIAPIYIEDEESQITGRLDILAVNKLFPTPIFWVLIVEAKNSNVEARAGLPQLLTYAYKSLEEHKAVWGLTTNGMAYQFIYIQPGEPPTYQILPLLDLMKSNPPVQLIQVLKAILNI